MKNFQSLYIEYFTTDLEAPFAYQLQTKLRNGKDGLNVDLKLEYSDREDFTEQDLIEEGAEIQEKFEWQGTLGKVWITALNEVLPLLKLSGDEDNKVFYIKAEGENTTEEGFLENTVVFETLFQELQQAVFEAAEKEYPLSLQVVSISKEKNADFTIIGSFAERKSLIIKSEDGKDTQKEIKWNDLRKILEIYFSLEFDPEKAVEEKPQKKGIYLEPGDSNWYLMEENEPLKKLIKMLE